jgi:signal peptidase I
VTRVVRARSLLTCLLLAGFWFVALRPQSLGGPVTYLVIRGDSMEPTYHGGDLVVVKAADRYSVGDVVAYRVPAGEIGAGHLVIHRIVGGDGDAGYLLRGDNNPSVDPWMPRAGDIAGTAWVSAAGAGKVLEFVHRPAVAGALAVAGLAMFMFLGAPTRPGSARRAWRERASAEVHTAG